MSSNSKNFLGGHDQRKKEVRGGINGKETKNYSMDAYRDFKSVR